MKLLVKFPTRSRGLHFLNVLRRYAETSAKPDRVHYLISYDLDDSTMSKDVLDAAKDIAGKNITLVGGHSDNKIHACNRDVEDYNGDWDIILLASDDMIPQVRGWDTVIASAMLANFSDLDGVLWFNDGHQKNISTFCIHGRRYHERFNYIYHPSYISLWCDNEYTEVARNLNKLKYYPNVLFYHDHPIWTGNNARRDKLYNDNESFYNVDKKNYLARKRHNFND